MNARAEYGINGAFKVDLYKSGIGDLYSTTDWFDNFITPTGLMYPLNYSFADCFRYLSLGYSSAKHVGSTGAIVGTTGLTLPISQYLSTSGYQRGQYIGWEGYSVAESDSPCGTTLSISPSSYSLRLNRGWSIPTGKSETYIDDPNGLSVAEFMVSPSSGESASGKYAFSRVTRNLNIPLGFRAIISYQLKVNIKTTGVNAFSKGTFATGEAEVENDLELVRGWSNLSGYYRQVYPGLRAVDNWGITYIPKFGDSMEPSSQNIAKTYWYLSPDNSQFDVNTTGGPQSSVSLAYSADGLMKSSDVSFRNILSIEKVAYDAKTYSELNAIYNNDSPSTSQEPVDEDILSNIRLGKADGSISDGLSLPQIGDYKLQDDNLIDFSYQLSQDLSAKEISYATPGVNKFSSAYSDFGKRSAITSSSVKLPISYTGQNLITGRKKTISRRSIFSPVSSLGYNTRFGSLVYGYNYEDEGIGKRGYYPLIDCLFFDTSGQSMMPHYRFISGIQLTERGTGILNINFGASGNTSDSIFKFVMRDGFMGPYSSPFSHAKLQEIAWSGDISNPNPIQYSGFLASGDTNNSYGNTGVVVTTGIDGSLVTGKYGWGQVYGIVVNSGFYDYLPDLGLIPHTTSSLQEPSATGKLYWPSVNSYDYLKFSYGNLTYYNQDMQRSFTDTGWFGKDRQIVKKIDFDLVDSSNTITTPDNFVRNVTGATSNSFSGYYLSKRLYRGDRLDIGDLVANSSYAITGYIIASGNLPLLSGMSYLDDEIPLISFDFIPTISSTTFSGVNGVRKISGLFTGITDRGYPYGTGENNGPSVNPITPASKLSVFFTGFSGASPIYVTYVSGINPDFTGYSNLYGKVHVTDFHPIEGYFKHGETYGATGRRLNPNFNYPNYYGSDIPSASIGGEYPGLSLDNGLELYLDISWSAPCGPSVEANSCLEPV